MDILAYTALELADAIKSGNVTVEEALNATFEQIDKYDKDINAFITLNKAEAVKRAKEVQEQIKEGTLSGKLAGVPIAIKDNICTKGIRTTCASRMLENFVPMYSAEIVDRLEKEGAIVIGKTNMDEFAFGSTNETSYYGVVKNPMNKEHVPGGSSGGSAAAVAAREAYIALGSDTGGSIRQPAAYCGLVGLKPTYGRVSRYGLVAFASSLDQIGPITKDVSDCAAIMEIISGHDSKDSTSSKNEDTEYMSALVDDVKGMKVGIPRDYLNSELASDVKNAIFEAAKVLEKKGAIIEEFDLGLVEYAVPVYQTISSAEASSNLERYDGVKYGYRTKDYTGLHNMYKKTRSEGLGKEAKRRIMLGAFVLSEGYYEDYYLQALKVKGLIKKAFDTAFESYDVILAPVAPTTAPNLGESTDPLKMYLSDIYTVSVNLAGIPAMSIPFGTNEKGLPIGIQLIANSFEEKKLIQVAYTVEQSRKGMGIKHDEQ